MRGSSEPQLQMKTSKKACCTQDLRAQRYRSNKQGSAGSKVIITLETPTKKSSDAGRPYHQVNRWSKSPRDGQVDTLLG